MTDETPAFELKKYNCNSWELVQAIDLLIQQKQWNDFARHQASEDPINFIKYIDSYRETEAAQRLCACNFDMWITKIPENNSKIQVIKLIRNIFGCGLAVAKETSEVSNVKLKSFYNLNATQEKYINDKVKEFEKFGCVMTLKNNDSKINGIFDDYTIMGPEWEVLNDSNRGSNI